MKSVGKKMLAWVLAVLMTIGLSKDTFVISPEAEASNAREVSKPLILTSLMRVSGPFK